MNAATRELMFSSARKDWTTPRDFYAELDAEFHFELDAAASDENHLAPCYYTEDSGGGGLDRKWYVSTFCNPPYGRGVTGRWVEKASREVREGRCPVAVLLLPSRTDTAWWHDYIWGQPGVEVRFVRGRLKFGGAEHGAAFPSVVVIFRRVP
jgi:phage N-6-adenine-methyltransferase